MLLPVSALLPIALFLAPAIKAHNDDDRPVSDCIPKCISTHASNVKTFSCEYFRSNAPLLGCINACPVDDIESYVDHLDLRDHCEEELFPSERDDDDDDDHHTTGTRTVVTPTPSRRPDDDDDDDHEENDCDEPHDDDWRTSNWSSWCTRHTPTGTRVTSIPTATDRAVTSPTPTGTPDAGRGNVTQTTGTSGTLDSPSSTDTQPAGNDDGAGVSSFGSPSVGVILMGFMAWAFLL